MSVEEAVIEREELYWSGVELQTEMIYQYKPDGQLIFVDDTFCRYFGKKSKQLIGQNLMQFIPQQDRNKFKHHLASFSRNNPSSTVNRRVMKSNGDIVWQRCHDSAIFDDRSRIKGYQTAGIEILGEQKIPEKEIILQNILDAIQDGISVLDKDLNILQTNSTLKKWYPNSGPIEGKKCHEVYHNRKKACKNCKPFLCFLFNK